MAKDGLCRGHTCQILRLRTECTVLFQSRNFLVFGGEFGFGFGFFFFEWANILLLILSLEITINKI